MSKGAEGLNKAEACSRSTVEQTVMTCPAVIS